LLEMRRQASRDNRRRCFPCCFGCGVCPMPVSEFYTTRTKAFNRRGRRVYAESAENKINHKAEFARC
jgi:hypothetical protein